MERNRTATDRESERRAAERLQLAGKLDSLGRMAGGIAHDFNNLLLAIMGNADLLDRDLRAGREGFALLDEIRKAAGRAADLCNQLTAFAGQAQFPTQTLDLSAAAREMAPMLKVAVARDVVVRLELADDLPLIEAGPAQIHQIIMNLVVNASEAISGAGTITIATDWGELDPGIEPDCVVGKDLAAGPYVQLEVRDTGAGMDHKTLQSIFDPVFSSKVHGRGLGLASVLGIVRGHGAVLRVDSAPGAGSRFRIHFPCARVADNLLPGDPPARQEARRGATILAVDDEEYVRVVCRRMLTRLGYRVILAESGRRAVEIYNDRRDEIDCVMLDLIMPSMDGYQVYEHLARLDPDVNVILTSGYHEQEIAERCAGQGIRGFLQKPYVIADLADILARVLPAPARLPIARFTGRPDPGS